MATGQLYINDFPYIFLCTEIVLNWDLGACNGALVCGGVFISLIQFPGFVPQSNGFVHHSECICIGQWLYLCLNV